VLFSELKKIARPFSWSSKGREMILLTLTYWSVQKHFTLVVWNSPISANVHIHRVCIDIYVCVCMFVTVCTYSKMMRYVQWRNLGVRVSFDVFVQIYYGFLNRNWLNPSEAFEILPAFILVYDTDVLMTPLFTLFQPDSVSMFVCMYVCS
jgi:hypothetical protein